MWPLMQTKAAKANAKYPLTAWSKCPHCDGKGRLTVLVPETSLRTYAKPRKRKLRKRCRECRGRGKRRIV